MTTKTNREEGKRSYVRLSTDDLAFVLLGKLRRRIERLLEREAGGEVFVDYYDPVEQLEALQLLWKRFTGKSESPYSETEALAARVRGDTRREIRALKDVCVWARDLVGSFFKEGNASSFEKPIRNTVKEGMAAIARLEQLAPNLATKERFLLQKLCRRHGVSVPFEKPMDQK